MKPHSSSPSTGARRPTFLRQVGTPVLAGATLAAVLAGVAGLTWVTSRWSSSCETDSCDSAAVMAGAVVPEAAVAGETTSSSHEPGHALPGQVVVVADEPASTDSVSVTPAPGNDATVESAPTEAAAANADPAPTTSAQASADSAPDMSAPATSSTPTDPDATPTTSAPTTSAPADAAAAAPTSTHHTAANHTSGAADYSDITTFGVFHGTSSHTHGDSLAGGRTAITTEALVAYNGLRAFHGREAVQPEAIGQWAFANSLTNNSEAYGEELKGVGLYYAMQGAKVGWIRDDAFDPQILADIQRSAREGGTGAVMTMVEEFGHSGYADHLTRSGLVDAFVNTLKMEPHYGGWMHGRVHGGLPFSDGTGARVATAHDVNHLTVLSHDQQQAFMNDTFDWPQWPALDVPKSDVINYFQSMVVLGDPHSDALP